MTFPTSSSPISFPGNALYPPGSGQTVQMSPAQRNIFNSISQNGQASLFQNPVSGAIGALGANITSLESTINNSTCGNYTSEQKANAISSLTGSGGLREQLELFTLHTNTLAGVVAGSSTNPTPGLERILSVGRSLNDLFNTIESASGCLSMLGNMSGLFSSEEVNGYANELTNMIAEINNCLGDLAQIVSRIYEIKTILENIISADINFFEAALETLRQAALSALMEYMYADPCGRFILENQIGRSTLLSFLK